MPGSARRAGEALRHPDFTRLFATRLASQFADGLFQALLVATVVFSPTEQDTLAGFAKALALLFVPFSLIGPFAGVFIDRWSRRKILVAVPALRVLASLVIVFVPVGSPWFYAAALFVLSSNRFFLATAAAVVPRLVPTEDLLMANSVASVGGTVANVGGIFVGGLIAGAVGERPLLLATGVLWIGASWFASRIRRSLSAGRGASRLHRELREAGLEFVDGIRRLGRTPRALWPILSMTTDQFVQGYVVALSLFVFRDRWQEGIDSYSWFVGMGAVGVFAGLATVGMFETHLSKARIVSLAFVVSGTGLVIAGFVITPITVLVVAFLIGLTFAWKKVPADTMVQEAVPDTYRGRVFSVYDVGYNLSRVAAAIAAISLVGTLGDTGSLIAAGALILLWAPILPAVVRKVPEFAVRFYAGSRGEQRPRAIVRGGPEEPVEVEDEWLEERNGERFRCFRLQIDADDIIDISRREPDGAWQVVDEG